MGRHFLAGMRLPFTVKEQAKSYQTGIGRVQLVLKKERKLLFCGFFLTLCFFIWITGHPEMADKSAPTADLRPRILIRKETIMNELRIAVLGAGNIGGTLGRKWAAAGHKVSFGVTNPDSERAQALRAELGTKVTIGSAVDALVDSDVVVMALPGKAMDETINKLGVQFDLVI